jgi:hypothetical protein
LWERMNMLGGVTSFVLRILLGQRYDCLQCHMLIDHEDL